MSRTTNCYVLTFSLTPGGDAHTAAIDYVKSLQPSLTSSWETKPFARLVLHDRHNIRGYDGKVIGNGESLLAHLFLMVWNADGDPPIITWLSVGTFGNNQDIIDYNQSYGIIEGGPASEIKFKHEVERVEGVGIVRSEFKVSDPGCTIDFSAEWIEPEPEHFPDELAQEDLVKLVPDQFLRFAYAPHRVFRSAKQETKYIIIERLKIPKTDFSFEIDINLGEPLGAIFNNLTEEDVISFLFSHNFLVLEEVTE